MNFRLVVNYLGQILIYFSIVFLIPILAAVYFKEDVFAFVYAAMISLAIRF